MILIISWPHDEHAQAVMAELDRRGARHFLLDVADLPLRAKFGVFFEKGSMRAVVSKDGRMLDLERVETVWLRRVSQPSPGRIHDPGYSVSECHNLLVGLAQALAHKRWVNPLRALALDAGYGKVRQIQVAQEVGLEIPRTCMTNDPEEARAFIESCKGGAIYKPFASREGRRADGKWDGIFTTEMTPEMMRRLELLRYAPGIFQEKIEKACDIRATVMGEKVFAIEIHSQERPESRTDYRRSYMEARHEVCRLPQDFEERLVVLHRALGLVFGTADAVRRPDGGYTFLETNQAGETLWCGKKTGLDLVGPLCDLLQGR